MRLPYFDKFRKWIHRIAETYGVVYLVFVSLAFAHVSGLVTGIERGRQPILVIPTYVPELAVEAPSKASVGVVASKSGTTFYYPWCSGRNRIKAENERWFSGPAEALKYGLKPAKNCLGL